MLCGLGWCLLVADRCWVCVCFAIAGWLLWFGCLVCGCVVALVCLFYLLICCLCWIILVLFFGCGWDTFWFGLLLGCVAVVDWFWVLGLVVGGFWFCVWAVLLLGALWF